MRNNTVKKELQMMAVPRINTIKKYDNFNDVHPLVSPNKKIVKVKKIKELEKRALNLNKKLIFNTSLMSLVMLFAMGAQMFVTYETSRLGQEKSRLEAKLEDTKAELQTMETEYLTNFDVKQVEEKLKSMGYVYNDTVEYVNLK